MSKVDKRMYEILDIVKSSPVPLSSSAITDYLHDEGYDISDRTVRHYLQRMDEAGLTYSVGRKGRMATDKGLEESKPIRNIDRVGLLSSKIDQMTYAMTFDLSTQKGTVIVNTTFISPDDFKTCLPAVMNVFKYGYAMGNLAAILEPGEQCGEVKVPAGLIGFTTVCCVTLNGVFLKHGIPAHSRFGGVLELRDGKAKRFTDIITYDGTTVDPLEVFIRSGMTDYLGATTTGNGKIGASFREIPADSRGLVVQLAGQLKSIGLGGILEIGRRGRPLFGIPVSDGRAGLVLVGGLNPSSIFEEKGVRVPAYALSGLLDFERLVHYKKLRSMLKIYM